MHLGIDQHREKSDRFICAAAEVSIRCVWVFEKRLVELTGQLAQVQVEPQPHEPEVEHPQSPMMKDVW